MKNNNIFRRLSPLNSDIGSPYFTVFRPLYSPSVDTLTLEVDDLKLPTFALCDGVIEGFEALESYVSIVTVVDVQSLMFMVSIDPCLKANKTLSWVVLLAIVTRELR